MDIPDNYGIVAFKHSLIATGEVNVITAGFHNTPIDDAATIADTMAAIFPIAFDEAYLSESWQLDSAYVQVKIGGVLQTAEGIIGDAGTRTSAPPSPACALGVKKQTSYAGKKYRGRFYLPAGWLTEAELSPAGVIDPSWLTPIQGFCDDLLAAMTTNSYPMYLLHNDATVPTAVNALIARNTVKTQRRRQHSS